ncbi:hypothetical protein L1856_00390 [Streptomyces sp. Tue 6430]|nr:hypothetical protein [Streptomyces sp. Tue 6430]
MIPLASLDDWLDFAESLLGTQDVAGDSLVAHFDTLDELERYEDELPEWMGMERFFSLESRYPWAGVARDVAERQGFFHWELEFGQVFAQGGYDLQVGNPPWVRPRWQEDLVLAELEPWFTLSDKPSASEWRLRKSEALSKSDNDHWYFLDELATNAGTVAALGHVTTYPLLSGTQLNLYRAFMCHTWQKANTHGITGLIHPDTHFSGSEEKKLRATAYQHLRFHGHFINKREAFPEIDRNAQFGIHIYGHSQDVSFTNMSWLFIADTIHQSFANDGEGNRLELNSAAIGMFAHTSREWLQ